MGVIQYKYDGLYTKDQVNDGRSLRGQSARASKTERKDLIYMKIQNLHKETNQISISRGCLILGISRSGYNKWIRQKQIHHSNPEEMKLKNEIQAIAVDFPRYGYRRITIELHRRGFEANHKVVYELMKIVTCFALKSNLSQRQLILSTAYQSIPIWQRIS